MNCMKCGREIALGQVFCKECLTYMEQHPVSPDTPVILPNRSAMTSTRRSSHGRKNLKPEEKVTRLQRLVLIQTLTLLVITIAFILTVMYMDNPFHEQGTGALPGQNYSTEETTA